MRKSILFLVLILVVGCAPAKDRIIDYDGTPDYSRESEIQEDEVPTRVIVGMIDKQFNQSVVKIRRGGTVTWRNEDIRPYFFIIYYKNVYPNGDVQIDKTATRGINSGEEFSYTFEKTGEYKLLPIEHGRLRGLVQVVE